MGKATFKTGGRFPGITLDIPTAEQVHEAQRNAANLNHGRTIRRMAAFNDHLREINAGLLDALENICAGKLDVEEIQEIARAAIKKARGE